MAREFERFGGVRSGGAVGPGWGILRYACRSDLPSASVSRTADDTAAVIWFGEVVLSASQLGEGIRSPTSVNRAATARERVSIGKEEMPDGSIGEAILAGWKNSGTAWLARLRGIFAGAIVDHAGRRVVLFDDRFGVRALFYARVGRGIVFSTRVLPICRLPGFRPRVNLPALARRLRGEFLRGDDTLIEWINQVPPATVLTLTTNDTRVEQYWTPRYEPDFRDDDAAGCADAFVDHLRQAIGRSLLVGTYGSVYQSTIPFDQSRGRQPEVHGLPPVARIEGKVDRPAGRSIASLLSGGLDSRIIVGCLASMGEDVDTWTYGLNGCWDQRFAEQAASIAGTRHHSCPVGPDPLLEHLDRGLFLTDGLLDLRNFHGLSLFGRLGPPVRSIFDGQAGDHFTGYLLEKVAPALREGEPETLYRGLEDLDLAGPDRLTADERHGLEDRALADLFRRVPDEYRRFVDDCRQNRLEDWFDAFHLRQRQRRYIANTVNAIRCQVPVLTPFLDYDFVDFALTIPAALRRDRLVYVEVFRRHFSRLADVPWTATGRPFSDGRTHIGPARMLWLRCRGSLRRRSGLRIFGRDARKYVDYDRWFLRHPGWRQTVMEAVLGADSRLAPFLKRPFREQMVDTLYRQVRRGGVIDNWVTIERWLRLAIP